MHEVTYRNPFSAEILPALGLGIDQRDPWKAIHVEKGQFGPWCALTIRASYTQTCQALCKNKAVIAPFSPTTHFPSANISVLWDLRPRSQLGTRSWSKRGNGWRAAGDHTTGTTFPNNEPMPLDPCWPRLVRPGAVFGGERATRVCLVSPSLSPDVISEPSASGFSTSQHAL